MPPIAETTTSRDASGLAAMMSATRRKHDASARLLPPNLWTTGAAAAAVTNQGVVRTTRGIGASRIAALYASVAKITAPCSRSSGFMRSIVSMFV